MSTSAPRQATVRSVRLAPAQPGNRAVFLVEVESRAQTLRVRELFATVGKLAEVAPVAQGRLMGYAVNARGDTALFRKVEAVLRTQCAFSLTERNFNEVTLRLVRVLCEESGARMAALPECGVCGTVDPFPTRVEAELAGRGGSLLLAYCARCCAAHGEEDPVEFARALLQADRRRLVLAPDAEVLLETAERPAAAGGWTGEAVATG